MKDFNKLMCEILEVEEITGTQRLVDFENWDSLTRLTIIAYFDSEYGVNFSAEDVEKSETIEGLKKLLNESICTNR